MNKQKTKTNRTDRQMSDWMSDWLIDFLADQLIIQ